MMGAGEHEADCIHIEALELSLRIGVPEEERAQAQRLTVSLTLWPLARFDGLADQIGQAVDYAVVVHEVQLLAAVCTDRLIETLAGSIAARLLAAFPIARVRVELRKFVLPNVKHVAVVITRERIAGA